MISDSGPYPRPAWLVGLAAFLCLAGYIYAYTHARATTPVRSDAFSYYVYLPSWLLYHDPTLQAVANDCCGGAFPSWTAIIRWPATNRWVNAHPIGEAILIAPFFAVAHGLTRWTNLTPDGFSRYYQHAAGLAGLFYVVVGLWSLDRLLRRHFGPTISAATLATLLVGTSLFHYATFDSTWSHAFSFALISVLFDRADEWRPGRTAIHLGIVCGLIVLVRHTNAIIPAAIVGTLALAAADGSEAANTRGPFDTRGRLRFVVIVAVVAGLVVLPQFGLYHAATGHWIVSSYGELGFTFAAPHIVGVLVSPQKGLFFYAPILLLAAAGFVWLPGSLRRWLPAIVLILLVDTYLIASWFDWQFGGSYGHRAFVDVYPLFAIGLASFYARVAMTRHLRHAVALFVVALCALSMFQMLQYWHGVLPMSDVTWSGYRAIFLQPWW